MPSSLSSTPAELACVDHSCPHCDELATEITALRSQVRELKKKNDELARAAVNRDYERPPHYL